ncbi:MAG: acyl carrier protein [Bacteroidetes bacterium]|nr:acyl carrier protein [Bacteroidota bacterium]
MNIQENVVNLIARVLEVTPEKINEDTAIGDIPSWDSLRHVTIIIELEKHFKVNFEPEIIMNMEDVSDIVAAIEERI